MRMWSVPPSKMCRRHLLGEHVELHMIVGSLNKGTSMEGYYAKGLVDTAGITERHEALVDEMTARGMHHKSPLPTFYDPHRGHLDPDNQQELLRRCPDCRSR